MNFLTFIFLALLIFGILSQKQYQEYYSFGSNVNGQLGLSTSYSKPSFFDLSNIKQISAKTSILFLTNSSLVYALGDNGVFLFNKQKFGQLGLNSFHSLPTPTLIGTISGVSQVAVGAHHSIFLTNSSQVFGTGDGFVILNFSKIVWTIWTDSQL